MYWVHFASRKIGLWSNCVPWEKNNTYRKITWIKWIYFWRRTNVIVLLISLTNSFSEHFVCLFFQVAIIFYDTRDLTDMFWMSKIKSQIRTPHTLNWDVPSKLLQPFIFICQRAIIHLRVGEKLFVIQRKYFENTAQLIFVELTLTIYGLYQRS